MIKPRLRELKLLIIWLITLLVSGRTRILAGCPMPLAPCLCLNWPLPSYHLSILCGQDILCCPEKARVGWLRHAARGSPHLGRNGFHTPPEGELLILLSLSYKQVVTLSGIPIPIPRNSNMEIQNMKSQKQFITLSTKTGICQQRHTIIGEHSLNGSSPAALRSLLRPWLSRSL